jgi:hypothetical protein
MRLTGCAGAFVSVDSALVLEAMTGEQKMRRHLTYANVTATLALVFAMSGGAIAAKHYLVSSTKQIDPKVLNSLAATDAVIFNRLAKTATVAKAQSAVTATSATSAVTAQSATTAASAQTASNALTLDGLSASSFTHSDCGSLTGQIKGFAIVRASAEEPNRFEPVEGYNCSGQAIEAKRTSPGLYTVRFDGNPAGIAIGTVNSAGPGGAEDPEVAFVSVNSLAPGEWAIHLYQPDPGTQPDVPFELLLP